MNLLKKISLMWLLITSFLVIVMIFLVVNYITFIDVNKLVQTTNIERHTVEVLEVLEEVLANLSDSETGQRGYLLTGELKYLEPYNSGILLVGTHIDNVQQLTRDNQNQQERILVLRDLVEQKKDELQETIDLRAEDKIDEAIEIVLSDRGKNIMDNIRVVIADMQEEERGLLEVRKIAATDAEENTRTIILFGSLIGLLMAVFLSLLISRYIGRVIENLRYVASQIAEGNMDIAIDTTGSNELSQLSGSIDIMRKNLKASLKDTENRTKELEQVNKTMTGREYRIVELKEENQRLKRKPSADSKTKSNESGFYDSNI